MRQVRATAAEALADAPSEVQHLAAAGVALYKTRLSDIGIREQVFLLHLIDGGRQIRAHNGSIFMYQDGAWQLFNGVVPESLLLRFRRFLLRLEGMFLVLAEKNDRLESERELLAAVAAAVGEMGELTTVEILESLEQKAFQKGSNQEEVAGEHRLLSAAKRTARISTTLQKELMHKTLFLYFAEWCSTKRPSSRGVCFEDACVTFDDHGNMDFVVKGVDRNIYVYVKHSLKDPCLDAALSRVNKFFSQTYVGNGPALKCHYAALALTLQGYNIDRCFWTVGPGGVGQSLTSHHLDAMCPGLHGFIDTNVYYSDDELRKRAEGLVGKLITTGQEAVEGSARAMREDVHKKHASADPVAARLPYGIVTKMVQLVGWKRMEMNRLIRFQGVTETSFHCILRRAWACKLKGRCVSPQQHASIRSAESYIIFIKAHV